MLDIKFIRENLDLIKETVRKRQLTVNVENVLSLDAKRTSLIQKVESLRSERNHLSKSPKPSKKTIKRGKEIKEELKILEPNLRAIEQEFNYALREIPNLIADDVIEGKNDTENEILRKWKEPTKFSFKPKDHLSIGEILDIIDVKRAAKVSGSRFGYLKGDAVRLEFALVQFAIETLTKEGFTPVVPPVLIKKQSMASMGYLEHGGKDDMFVLEKDDFVLVGTSEQSIGPMHMNETIEVGNLPLRYMGFSSCFRREAGSYGKDTRGILRVHQFDKVEMFSFTLPENGDKEHEYLLSLEEKFLQALKIPYQVVKMCSGDLGAPAYRKYDLEAWMPGQNKYREVTSTSTTTDFQSRRLNIRYKDGSTKGFVHMLNGTAFAIGRIIIAILENYQQKDGSVTVPKVLQKYVGKEKFQISKLKSQNHNVKLKTI